MYNEEAIKKEGMLMKRQNPSIFNDIVGPIMVGPSSSHTCGPTRIGYLCRQLVKGTLKKAVVAFPRNGAYTLMYKGQRSDLGFAGGLLGFRPEDPRVRQSFALAKENGLEVDFLIEDFEPTVPNLCQIRLTSDAGETIVVETDSTGGGTVKLLSIKGFPVAIVGDCYELLVEADLAGPQANDLAETIKSFFQTNEGSSVSSQGGQSLINVKQREEIKSDLVAKIKALPGVSGAMVMIPVLAVPSNRHAQIPFVSAEKLLEAAETQKRSLWELALDYESARSGWTHDEVYDYMKYVIVNMEKGVKEALTGNINMSGIIEPTAGKVENYMKTAPKAINMGVLNMAVPWAMATMEYSSAMGVVFCAPTGGSAGVMPGAILGVAESLGLSLDDKIKAMLVTSVVGIVMSQHHNYSAELYGCQVEPGAASAMAAAGLVYLMDGTPAQAMAAASCALQNILGTICDPVAGLVQIPCINRNAMSAANAVVSANMIMGGFDPLITLDEAAETMFRVGKQLPSELRCTCKGGLCITPSGQRLAEEQNVRDAQR